jgi:hypothetical protein
VVIPWPQDFVLGTGRKNHLTYDDLDILQWAQGCIAIVEKEENPAVVRSVATLRSTLRDAQFHGFDAAKCSYGALLSLMEDGTVSWLDAQNIAEERRSALIASGSQSHSRDLLPSHHSCSMNGGGVFRSGGARSKNMNSPNSPSSGNITRPGIYWNQGNCPQKGDHQGVSVFWKHV